MDFRPGDIVFVPFPFTNLSSAKMRPALVILNIAKSQDVIILAITSKLSNSNVYVVENKDLKEGELPVTSYIRYDKVATLESRLIRKKIACLKENVFRAAVTCFKRQF